MATLKPNAGRVTGHLKLIERKHGPVWFVKTRVPGRDPEQTTRRLAPAHLTGGKPPTGHLTRKQAQDELADILALERQKVGQRAYEHGPATFADAAAGYLHYLEHVRGREATTPQRLSGLGRELPKAALGRLMPVELDNARGCRAAAR